MKGKEEKGTYLAQMGRLVRLQIDNFRLFLCQQKDDWQIPVCTMTKRVKGLRKIAWAPFSL
jgi:hypothetical protein